MYLMKHRDQRRRFAVSPLVWVCLFCLLLCAGWQVSADLDRDPEIRRRTAELTEMKQRIEGLRQRINDLQTEGRDLESLLAELERKRSLNQSYINTLDTQIRSLEHDIAVRQHEADAMTEELSAMRSKLSQTLLHYYKTGRVNTAELLISSASFGEIFARSHYWARAIKNIRLAVGEVSQRRLAVQAEVSVIEQQRRQAVNNRNEKSSQEQVMAREEQTRRQTRVQLDQRVAKYQKQMDNLLAAQKQVEQTIADYRRRSADSVGNGLQHLRKKLPWPVKGNIVTRFGTHVHPKYGTKVRQQGVEISAAEGTPIRAVAAASVVFAGWLEGYGNTVILDHGKEFFTLYGHASQILVTRGEMVSGDKIIAKVGSTDSMKGSNLHFEIRRKSEALNPANWLK
jgi:murein hydrolase activator